MRFSEMSEEDKALRLLDKPQRKCNSMHECCICFLPIHLGQYYKDGGYGKRAHETCIYAILKGLR